AINPVPPAQVAVEDEEEFTCQGGPGRTPAHASPNPHSTIPNPQSTRPLDPSTHQVPSRPPQASPPPRNWWSDMPSRREFWSHLLWLIRSFRRIWTALY